MTRKITLRTLALASVLTATSALGHSFYNWECCSGKDCQPIPAGDVKATPNGWLVEITGEMIAYGSYREKKSPDGSFHRCAGSADFSSKGRTLCLYVPDMGF